MAEGLKGTDPWDHVPFNAGLKIPLCYFFCINCFPSLMTMSATKVSAFLHDIEKYGASCEYILQAAQLNAAVLQYPDHRITSLEFRRVLQETVRLTGDENIGLLQGEDFLKGFSNIVGYVLMNCRTLGEAADKYCKYEKIVDGTSISKIQETNGQICLKCTMIDDVLTGIRQFSDFRAAGILSFTKHINSGGRSSMGKNKPKTKNPDDVKGKTQELEETKRLSKGFYKDSPTKTK